MSEKTFQGDIGVAAATLFYSIDEWVVSKPNTEHCKYDLIIEKCGTIKRVQVKTSNYKPKGKYLVQLRTSGGNHSTRTVRTKLKTADADLVFILCGDGKMYELPISLVAGKAEITISSKGYDEYVVGELGLDRVFRQAGMV